MFNLTEAIIDRESLIQRLQDQQAGALVSFEGWVRDHNQGKKVSSLEYQVYLPLAKKEGEKILQQARERFNLHHIVCTHRFGHLKLGEIAVWVGAIATHRDDAFKASRFVIDEIKLRLPIWKKEHYVDEKAEWVFCKHHHTHVHFPEAEYYQKQAKLTDQACLKDSRVLVIGAGGLGCPVLTALTSAGVGQITIVDFDKISISNIHRQPLYAPEVVGEKKVTVAKNRLMALNPFIKFQTHDVRVSTDNVEQLIAGQDLILDCTDNLETKFLLHDACFKMRLPLISASIYQYEGQIRTFIPDSEAGCLRCTHTTTPDDAQMGNCNDFGVLGASVAVIGSIQASEALLLLQQQKNNTTLQTFYLNLKTLSQMKIKNIRQEHCLCCQGNIVLTKTSDMEIEAGELQSMDVEMVDVRDMKDSELDKFITSSKAVVVCCHRGVRSKQLVAQMRAKGHSHFYSLKGGACSL